jgi:hypothetical protein
MAFLDEISRLKEYINRLSQRQSLTRYSPLAASLKNLQIVDLRRRLVLNQGRDLTKRIVNSNVFVADYLTNRNVKSNVSAASSTKTIVKLTVSVVFLTKRANCERETDAM